MTSLVEKVQEANGFTAINCEDGYRKDNSLWFGECSVCGERITNSRFDNFWVHTQYLEKGYNSKEAFERGGISNTTKSKHIDFCPVVAGVEFDTIVWYKDENGEKIFV